MLYRVTLTFEKKDKNNHLRKKFIVFSEDEKDAIKKVKRTLRCKDKLLHQGSVFNLINTKVCVYEDENIKKERLPN